MNSRFVLSPLQAYSLLCTGSLQAPHQKGVGNDQTATPSDHEKPTILLPPEKYYKILLEKKIPPAKKTFFSLNNPKLIDVTNSKIETEQPMTLINKISNPAQSIHAKNGRIFSVTKFLAATLIAGFVCAALFVLIKSTLALIALFSLVLCISIAAPQIIIGYAVAAQLQLSSK